MQLGSGIGTLKLIGWDYPTSMAAKREQCSKLESFNHHETVDGWPAATPKGGKAFIVLVEDFAKGCVESFRTLFPFSREGLAKVLISKSLLMCLWCASAHNGLVYAKPRAAIHWRKGGAAHSHTVVVKYYSQFEQRQFKVHLSNMSVRSCKSVNLIREIHPRGETISRSFIERKSTVHQYCSSTIVVTHGYVRSGLHATLDVTQTGFRVKCNI